MKKYGKYEKRPEGVPEKQPKVKSALLQTYFTSLLCMVLCVTMFFGTSYAWFTSEVQNTGNEIYVGTLKVGLYKVEDGKSVSLISSDTCSEKLFNSDIRWEPGYTTLETIQVTNEGDLAFKYAMNFTSNDAAVESVAQNFEVWVFNHYQKTYEAPDSYEEMVANSDWVKVGTLAEVLNGTAVLKDRSMYTVRQDDSETDATTPNGTPDGVKTIDTYTIALHMKKDTSDASLMGKKITLNVKLVAYQMSSENDGFGNPSYDDGEFVTTVEELQKALDNATGKTVIRLADDITGDVKVTQKPDVNITIDGNGKTYSGSITIDGKSATIETAGIKICNVNFDATAISKDACINMGVSGDNNTRYVTNLTVENCTFTGDLANEKTAVKSYTGGDKNLTVTDCQATGMHTLVQVKNVTGVTVSDCEVNGKNGISVGASTNVVISKCTITATGYGIRADGSAGGDMTLTGNTVNAAKQPVVVRKLTAAGYKLDLQGTNNLATGSDPAYQIVLTTGDDEAAYVSPPAEYYTITGGESFNIYK